MDPKDAPALKEGSGDDDGKWGLSVTASLAKDAALQFQSRRFSECAALLVQIVQKKPNDPKVLHNIAVVEYLQGGCSDPRKLLDVLVNVKRKSEELASASGAQAQGQADSSANLISGSRGSSSTLHQFSAANIATIAYAGQFDTSIITLNMAVILFHLKEYESSLSLLEPLYQNIEPIDETTALHVCLLFLDVALAMKDAKRAAGVILYLERAFGVGHSSNHDDNGPAQSSSNQTAKISTVPSGLTAPDASGSDTSGVNASENPPTGALSDDTAEYETFISTLDSSGENLKRQQSNDPAVPAVDLKLKLQLYKVQFLLLTRNLKAAKREVKVAINNSRGKDSSYALLLKSQLEYSRGNYRKAIKLLGNRMEAEIASMVTNNIGCIYHQLGKHNAATMLFAKALKSSSSLRADKPLKLPTFSQDKSLLVVYNCGVQNLLCGRPLIAAHCFHKASPILDKQPIFWLRFSECCLLALEKGLLKVSGYSESYAEEARISIIGSGKWRQLNIDTNSRNRTLNSLAEDGLLTKDGQHRLSIPLARKFLLNALHLLNRHALKGSRGSPLPTVSLEDEANATSASTLATTISDSYYVKGCQSSNTLQSSVSAYNDMVAEELHLVRQAVLANIAYVELCLENPVKALTTAQTLLGLYNCSRIYIFLGHVYAAEALCLLNRPKESVELLSQYISDAGDVELPYSQDNLEKCKPVRVADSEEVNGSAQAKTFGMEVNQGFQFAKPEEARGMLLVELAALSAVQGDSDKALRYITKAVSIIPNNPRAMLAAVYVDLLVGRTQDALAKLKRCHSVSFLPKSVASGNS